MGKNSTQTLCQFFVSFKQILLTVSTITAVIKGKSRFFALMFNTLATPPENIRKELSFCCYPHKLTTASVLLLPLYRANAVTAISLPKQQKKAAFAPPPISYTTKKRRDFTLCAFFI